MNTSEGEKTRVRNFWDARPCGTFGRVPLNPTRSYFDALRERRYRLEPFILEILDSLDLCGKEVLEIGCGVGTDGVELARRGAQYTGVDASPASLNLARANFYLHSVPGVLTVADAEKLPFPDQSFDFIYSWGVLHHTPGMDTAVREVHRVLRPGGRFCIMLYNRRSLVGLQLWILYALFRLRPWTSFRQLFAGYHESPGTQALTDNEARYLFRGFNNARIRNVVTPYDMRITRNFFLPAFSRRIIPSMFGFFKIIEEEK